MYEKSNKPLDMSCFLKYLLNENNKSDLVVGYVLVDAAVHECFNRFLKDVLSAGIFLNENREVRIYRVVTEVNNTLKIKIVLAANFKRPLYYFYCCGCKIALI